MFDPQDLSKKQIAEFEAENPDIKIRLLQNDSTRLNAMPASGSPVSRAAPSWSTKNRDVLGYAPMR
jgi:ABC-type glycerol-3-phosphate transport system substrate-binding protein